MQEEIQHTVTRLLNELQGGNEAAFDELFAVVYDELRSQAHRQRQSWQGDFTLNTTALVHEAYLKLVGNGNAGWESRAHFLATAAKAMRQILLNYAKNRRRQKRGGDRHRISLDDLKAGEELVLSEDGAEVLVILDEALDRLEAISPRQGRIVECRFFGGLTIQETAAALDVSPMTVKRSWTVAQLWLFREIQREIGVRGPDADT